MGEVIDFEGFFGLNCVFVVLCCVAFCYVMFYGNVLFYCLMSVYRFYITFQTIVLMIGNLIF